jgi:Flp pilus assembly protein TadG
MKLNKFIPKKNVAQAMVEFAIVLPILLLLLYGLLEVGRLLFMYTTVINAGRQAVRYGSATGIGTGTVLRYQDCTGIRLAANKADYLNAFNHETDDVKIFWDNGPTDAVADRQICTVGTVSSSWTPTNESRLLVYVEGHFNPLVKLVPLPQRNIKSTSARTILGPGGAQQVPRQSQDLQQPPAHRP